MKIRTLMIACLLTTTTVALGCDENKAADDAVVAEAQEGAVAVEEEEVVEAEETAPEVQEPAQPAAATPGMQVSKLGLAQHEGLGEYIVDGQGRSVYLFEADKGASGSTCYDKCAEMWPPVLGSDDVQLAEGLDQAKLGTIERKTGTRQLTYGGWPLYYYKPDTGPGQRKGQDIMDAGAEWYLISPEGQTVHQEGEEH